MIKIPGPVIPSNNSDKSFPDHVVPTIKAKFERIYKTLVLFWGSKDFHEFMNLTVTMAPDRIGRIGFPKEVMSEFLKLQVVHDRVFPELINQDDKWYRRM